MAGFSVTYTVVDQATAQIDAINRRIAQLRAPLERQAKSLQKFVDVSGLRQVANSFQNISKSAFSAFESISRIVPAMGALTGAASVTGMFRLAQGTSQWATALQLSASRIGTSFDQLAKLQGATQLAGGSVDDMTEGLKELGDKLRDAFTNDPVQAQWFKQFNVNILDANAHLRQTPEVLGEVLAAINKQTNAHDRHTVAVRLGGEAMYRLSEQFRLSGKSLDQFVSDYESKFPPMSKAQLDALAKWRASYAETETAIGHLGNTLGATLAKDLEPLLRWFNQFVEKNEPEIVQALEAIGAAVTVLGGLFVVQIAGKAVASVAALSLSLTRLLASPAGVVLMAMLGLKAAIEQPGDVLPGTSLFKSFRNIFQGKAPWADFGAPGGGTGAPSPAAGATPSFGQRVRNWLGLKPRGSGGGAANDNRPGAGGGSSGGVSLAQMKQLALNAGFTAEEAPIIAATLMHESSGNPNARGKAGELGLAQVHPRAWGQDLANQSMGNPQRSMEIARMIYNKQGFNAWTSYNSGAYKQYLDAANAAKPEPYVSGSGTGRNDPSGAYGVPGAVMNYGGTGALGAPGSNLTQIATPSGKGVTVNAAAAQAFQGFLNELEGTGYKIGDIGGYGGADRRMRGGTALSEHAFGNAIDINPSQNAMGGSSTNMPPGIKAMAAKYGLIWGGDWQGKSYDPMHFQWGGPKAGGAPAQVTGGAPVSGSVDVTVTHKNPPPGSTVTATATGDATVGTPRVERQQLTAP